MINYKIKEMKQKPKGTRVLFGPIEVPLSLELQYRKLLNRHLAAIAAEVRRSVLPAVRADRELTRREKAMSRAFDAPSDSWFAQLREFTRQLIEANRPLVEDIFELEAKRHSETFMTQARSKLGIDLSAVIHEEDIRPNVDMAVDRNVGLITNMSEEALNRIQQLVYQNASGGGSVDDLKKKLVNGFQMSSKRAKVIARDQTSKFNGELNKIRQTQAGVDKYEWSTSHDERVRDLHRSLDGKIYRWGEKTGAEDGLPPGQPILCRCVAIGIVEW